MSKSIKERFSNWRYRRKFKKWIANLQVGDIVCNCSYKHLAIKDMYVEPTLNSGLMWLIFKTLPTDAALTTRDFLLDKLMGEDEQRFIPILMEIYDADLVLEDGSGCSARHCCWMPDHPWPHPE
jgi:hypothetical protein